MHNIQRMFNTNPNMPNALRKKGEFLIILACKLECLQASLQNMLDQEIYNAITMITPPLF